MEKKKICFVAASPNTADFLAEQMILLHKEFGIYLAANGELSDLWKTLDISEFHSVPIRREIAIRKDLKALLCLYRYFRKMKFDAVHSISPKGGFICALAAFFAGVPHRSHSFTGQVWATRTGAMRLMLKSLDWLTAHLDNHIFADGEGQRQFIIQEGVVSEKKSRVFANGSIAGIRVDRFCPSTEIRVKKRKELGLTDEKIVFVFAGRLNRDKGCYELLAAFNELVQTCPDAYLLLFGKDEENVSESFNDYPNLKDKVNFNYYGLTREMDNMLQACDIFVLPTYREGFGVSVLEAQAMELPVITSDVYGVVDASVDGVTGLHVPVRNVEVLRDAMTTLYNDKQMRVSLGKAGRERVLKEFRSEVVANAWLDFYHNIFN